MSRMRVKVSAPITITRRAWPATISALALARAKTKPAQTAWMSKAKPWRMPRPAWTMVAVEGKVRSGVEVATMIASRSSACSPASASAALAAMAMSEVVSPSGGEMAPLDAGAGADPFVGGVDLLLEPAFGTTRSGR